MIRIYTWALRLGLAVLSPYFLLQSRKYWPTVSDRLGRLKVQQLKHTIWVHAVSVGEVKAVENLIGRLRVEFPDRPIVISTTTTAGQELAQEHFEIIDDTLYFPLDLPGPVNRALDRIQPDLVIIAETEIWPNFLHACRKRNVPVLMINGRISDKSLPGYMRFRRWLGPVFDNYLVLGMQSETDRQRIESIGADPERVKVFGNLKYDVSGSGRQLPADFSEFLRTWGPLWIAASTMPGEDEFVLDAFAMLQAQHPDLKLMIAPRHPDRSGEIIGLAGLRSLKCMRRTALGGDANVLILDTIGELAACFECASVVFMGGSLVERGGHNILEPARFSKPVIFGPHMENFRDIARLFLDANAAIQIPNASALPSMVECVLTDPRIAKSLGENANAVVRQNMGATDRVMEFIRTEVFNA